MQDGTTSLLSSGRNTLDDTSPRAGEVFGLLRASRRARNARRSMLCSAPTAKTGAPALAGATPPAVGAAACPRPAAAFFFQNRTVRRIRSFYESENGFLYFTLAARATARVAPTAKTGAQAFEPVPSVVSQGISPLLPSTGTAAPAALGSPSGRGSCQAACHAPPLD